MSTGTFEKMVKAPIEDVWDFIRTIDQWAPLAPGYIDHTIINDEISQWTIKIDAGMLKKKLHVEIEIREWSRPNYVTFELRGLNEKLTGSGSFLTEGVSAIQTKIIGSLSIQSSSSLRKIITPLIEKTVPEMTRELTLNVGSEIEKHYSIR
ncbi:SRPBCC family protein [Rossellomorea aquimaris]|uniref:CoxG family protein n=1 Tax=Rossellomorea aquimaris TaxID=189382 RepID=UPI001CD2F1B9|nr:SRPBCC family protein [Rossellomorea aquimaris]MCA1053892.1 SRPBCC family protein [Rossellomorea aquimaris]